MPVVERSLTQACGLRGRCLGQSAPLPRFAPPAPIAPAQQLRELFLRLWNVPYQCLLPLQNVPCTPARGSGEQACRFGAPWGPVRSTAGEDSSDAT